MQTVNLFGFSIAKINLSETVQKIEELVEKGQSGQVMTINPEYVVRADEDEQLKKAIANSSLIVADGAGIIWASKLIWLKKYLATVIPLRRCHSCESRNLYRFRIKSGMTKENQSGMTNNKFISSGHPELGSGSINNSCLNWQNRIRGGELVEKLVELVLRKGWKIGLIGAEEGVVEKALKSLKLKAKSQKLQRDTSEVSADFTSEVKSKVKSLRGFADEGAINVRQETPEEHQRILGLIIRERPQILLTAFGFYGPIWLAKILPELKSRGVVLVAIEVGGVFNYLVGKARRAPRFLSQLGLEWLWRLFNEPWRIKRQLKLWKFVKMTIKAS